MQTILNLLSVAVIGASDGPTVISVAESLPLPAIVIAVLGVAFVIYVYVAKAVNANKAPKLPADEKKLAVTVAPAYTGPVLNGVDEKEAAVIMAIVSHKTGIPLNRLKFDSITLKEDK